jgi:outer membrane protein assembly factor BamB
MSILMRFGLAALTACSPKPAETTSPSPPARSAAITKPPGSLRCGPAPAPQTTESALTGTIPAWNAPLGRGTGALRIDVEGGLVVARLQGGKSVTVDIETGAVCSALVREPQGALAPGSIDPYTDKSVVVSGALIGPSGLEVAAVDLHTGAPLWSRQLLGIVGDYRDEYALRDGMHTVSAGSLAVIGFYVRHMKGHDYRFQELVIGVDPATGAEKWRRAVVEHAWGEPLRVGGNMRLSTDGQRAIIETPDRILAIDGATGSDAWSVAWPRESQKRAFVGAGRVLMAIDSAPLDLRASSDGKRLALVPSPGKTITGAVVRRDSFTVAVENAPGNAFIAAFDELGRRRWTRPAAYSVTALSGAPGDEPSTVFVLDGSDRLFAIDERTGAEQGGLTAGYAPNFALAKTRSGISRVILPLDGLTAFDLTPESRPKPLDAFLRWQFDQRATPDGPACHPSSVAWVDGEDAVVWKRDLPPRLRSMSWGLCNDHEYVGYMRRPRQSRGLLYSIIGVEGVDDALIVADGTGVLALHRRDGAALFDRATAFADPSLFFDSGTFHLDTDPPCSGPSRHARIFARCGSALLFFNGSTALLIDPSSWRVTAEATYTPAALLSGGHKTEAAFKLGGRTLSLKGVTYMH